MPIVVQLDPSLVPGAVLLSTVAVNAFVIFRDRKGVNKRLVLTATLGAMIGATLGSLVLRRMSDDSLGIVIAVCVLAAVAISLVHRSPARTSSNMAMAGVASGFSGSTAGIAGPPMALMFAGAPAGEFRGTLGMFFLTTSATSFTALFAAGRFGSEQLIDGVMLMPATLLAFAMSRPLLRFVDGAMIRPAVLLLSTVSAVVLLVRLAF